MHRFYLRDGLYLSLFVGLLFLPCKPALGVCEQHGSLKVVRLLEQVDQELSANQPLAAQQRLELFKLKYADEQHYLIDYHLGNLYSRSGQLEKALSAYDAALSGCDQEPGIWQNRGKIAWDLKRYPVAADSLSRAYELDLNKEPSLLFHTAIARIYADQKDVALNLLEYLIGDVPEAVQDIWLETYTNLCLELKQTDRALEHLTHWHRHFETRKVFWRLLAILHVQLRQYEEGAANLKVLAAFEPLNKTDKKLLADLLLQVNIPLEAAELYEELLTENPTEQQLHEQTIICYRLGLQPQKALDAIERALVVYRSVDLLQTQGEIFFDQGQYEQAFQVFEQLLHLDSDKGIAYLYQGYCALRMEDLALARKVLTRASSYKSERKEAKRLLEWMNKG
ncbi:tetratricopeptide repeat protein [uncultured Desulfuromusa sp.]|uniref:tetratricopeptide repeat protein n=1 Tax=uncultured Desulfuromusa sp. TaxID=219183 RepID=UPI002AA70B26|nr:tetratricopeptide repeat protein [uncultured Desulfuromusa sp.]